MPHASVWDARTSDTDPRGNHVVQVTLLPIDIRTCDGDLTAEGRAVALLVVEDFHLVVDGGCTFHGEGLVVS